MTSLDIKKAEKGAFHIRTGRRHFFKSMAAISAGFMAEALTLSPIVTQGPCYPLASNIPLDNYVAFRGPGANTGTPQSSDHLHDDNR